MACRFLMLQEGLCLDANVSAVAKKYGYCRQRFYQLLDCFKTGGMAALEAKKTGPKSKYRRTSQAIHQVLRQRFLDPECSVDVIAQKLNQTHFPISVRSVNRVIADYGLQKKLYAFNPTKEVPPLLVQSTRTRVRLARLDPQSIEAGGWKKAGTLNLHIRTAQLSFALMAQGLIHQLRQRLGEPCQRWDSPHFARDFFSGLEGDLRVEKDTLVVTYYNAPQAEKWKHHYEKLSQMLQKEGIDPRIPWLYDFKLDSRFR
jgi:transposase